MYSLLTKANNEKDVENYYRSELLNEMRKHKSINSNKVNIESPFKCDGVLNAQDNEDKRIVTLLEFKKSIKLHLRKNQCGILAQMLYYLKNFHDNDYEIPTSIFAGDDSTCFVCETHHLILHYLHRKDIDWTIAPSQVSKVNISLVEELINDTQIQLNVFEVDSTFKLKRVVDKLIDITEYSKIDINNTSAEDIFSYFSTEILIKSQLSRDEKLGLFLQIIDNYEDVYMHPRKWNILVTDKFGQVAVQEKLYDFVFNNIVSDFSVDKIASILKTEKQRKIKTIPNKIETAEIEKPIIESTNDSIASLFELEDEADMQVKFYNKLFLSVINEAKTFDNYLLFYDIAKKITYNIVLNEGEYDSELDSFKTYDLEIRYIFKDIKTPETFVKNLFASILHSERKMLDYPDMRVDILILSKDVIYFISKEQILEFLKKTDYNIVGWHPYKNHIIQMIPQLGVDKIIKFDPTKYTPKSILDNVLKIDKKNLQIDLYILFAKNYRLNIPFGIYLLDFFISIFEDNQMKNFINENRILFIPILADIMVNGSNSYYLMGTKGNYSFVRNSKYYVLNQNNIDALLKCKKNYNSNINFDKKNILNYSNIGIGYNTELYENFEIV